MITISLVLRGKVNICFLSNLRVPRLSSESGLFRSGCVAWQWQAVPWNPGSRSQSLWHEIRGDMAMCLEQEPHEAGQQGAWAVGLGRAEPGGL